jgi:hypothetical protein
MRVLEKTKPSSFLGQKSTNLKRWIYSGCNDSNVRKSGGELGALRLIRLGNDDSPLLSVNTGNDGSGHVATTDEKDNSLGRHEERCLASQVRHQKVFASMTSTSQLVQVQ